jgi:RNase H-like domain found in reverse transcriptase
VQQWPPHQQGEVLLGCLIARVSGPRCVGDRVAPLPSRIAAIKAHPKPATIQQLQGFLGLFNFYRRFIPAAAAVIKPLTDTLKGSKSGKTAVEWTPELSTAFLAAKDALSQLCHLEHPAAAAELSIATNASATHTGGVLQQRLPGGHWRPLGFYSAKLDGTQQRYSTFDRELLAVETLSAISGLCSRAGPSSFLPTTGHW